MFKIDSRDSEMEYIKIALITSVHRWDDVRIFYREAKSLAKRYEVELHAPAGFKYKEIEGVKVLGLPKVKRIFRLLNWLKLFLRILRSKADIYHFQDPELIPLAIITKLIKQKRIICDVHEDVPKQILAKEWIPLYLRAIVSGIFSFIERVCFLFFDAAIVAGADIAAHFPSSKKVTVVRNFPLLEIVKNINIKKRERRKESITLIYTGGLSKDRGIKEIIQAVCYIKNNVKLVLVGSFSSSHLEVEIKEKSNDRVEFIGQVPYERVFQCLEEADIGLILFHPTPNNLTAISGRNNKIFEYMASGLPIVASDFPGWKETIEEGGYGITVDPLNPKDIARGIEELIKDPVKRRKMGERGRQAVIEKYNWEAEAKKLFEVYEKLYH